MSRSARRSHCSQVIALNQPLLTLLQVCLNKHLTYGRHSGILAGSNGSRPVAIACEGTVFGVQKEGLKQLHREAQYLAPSGRLEAVALGSPVAVAQE
eukprot:532910-Pelagomonas_calceolata.AAC.7